MELTELEEEIADFLDNLSNNSINIHNNLNELFIYDY